MQGDPFASPSRVRVIVKQNIAKIPLELFNENHKKIASQDYLTRLFYRNINKFSERINAE